MTDHDTTALSTLSAPQAQPAAAAPNPLLLVQDRLQNRWRMYQQHEPTRRFHRSQIRIRHVLMGKSP